MSPRKRLASFTAAQTDPQVQDRLDCRVPNAIFWSTNQVASWMEEIGFPAYRNCITTNFITGRHLIHLDASALPKIGICDFDHIKFISNKIRELLKLEPTPWDCGHISYPPRTELGMYLETKSVKGHSRDKLSYEVYLTGQDRKWKPPLTNYGFLTSPPKREGEWCGKKAHIFTK